MAGKPSNIDFGITESREVGPGELVGDSGRRATPKPDIFAAKKESNKTRERMKY